MGKKEQYDEVIFITRKNHMGTKFKIIIDYTETSELEQIVKVVRLPFKDAYEFYNKYYESVKMHQRNDFIEKHVTHCKVNEITDFKLFELED